MHDNPVASAQVDRAANRTETHAKSLAASLNNLGRASLQCDNMLRRLRGNHPETGADKIPNPPVGQVDPPIMQRLDLLSEQIQDISNQLNNQVDEMQEYI